MFKIKKEYEYTWPVTVKTPSDKVPGKFTEETFNALYRMESTEKAQERMNQLKEMTDGDFTISLLEAVWLGWKDGEILDDDNNPVPNTPENRELLLSWPHSKSAILTGYTSSINGQAAQARKRGN